MSIWESYPQDYRKKEIDGLLSAVQGGECAALVGLSGSGKSNLLGFMADRCSGNPWLALVDCNRLAGSTPGAFYALACQSLGVNPPAGEEIISLEKAVEMQLTLPGAGLCFLFDRFDGLPAELQPFVWGSLRALRDRFKYRLTYICATRHPLSLDNELAELLDANILWLGPLCREDALWSANTTLERIGKQSTAEVVDRILTISGMYPALLRACCQAFASGCEPEADALRQHPAVMRRVNEFWNDRPTEEEIKKSGLENHPLLAVSEAGPEAVRSDLTEKEARLLEYLVSHCGQICEKDDLIQAVWPEDKVFVEGIRDDSLAQLVRRLRRKIETDPDHPRRIANVIGRGYRYVP